MDNSITPEEGQKQIDNYFNNLPSEIEKNYAFLTESVRKFQTFDLLSYFSYYNHLHNSEKYSDYRGDKNFYVSEVLALLCLKNKFIPKSSISEETFMELIMKMQKSVLSYCGLSDMLEFKNKTKTDNTISDIANLLTREAKVIRNPGLPDHHLIFAEKLFEPISSDIEALLGFTVAESVIIRKCLPDLINKKCKSAIDKAMEKGNSYAKQIIKYKKSKIVEAGSEYTKEQLEEYSKHSDKEIKHGLQSHLLNELFYTFSLTYTFAAEELAEFSNVDIFSVIAFLNKFSCNFPSLKENDKIYDAVTLLKTTPLIEHNNQYLIPSFPLLIWAVEDVIELEIKKNQKLNEKYPNIKHDFLLKHGLQYFKSLLPTASLIESNLFYYVNNERCETDGLIIYDKVLFIIEAKGHRITKKAKAGHELKTQDHLKDIVRDSYAQGIRTLKHLEENKIAEFKTKDGKKIEITREDYDDIIIVSLTLEPIGNLTMAIKATNEIGYFNDGHFPWIISIYDLVVFVDLFENPILLIHYIKRRKKFLSHNFLSTYEELDLLAYFLSNGLYIEHTIKDAEEKNVTQVNFFPETDEINDYYMYKFGKKTKFTNKPKFYLSKDLNDFLLELDRSKVPHRVRMALLLLEFNNKSIKQLMDYVKKIKKAFSKDKSLHDCSIYTESIGGLGATFMTGLDKSELCFKLHQYCSYKLQQLNSNAWIGFGDSSTDRTKFCFEAVFFAMNKKVE